jgi:P27 family predicted phage terminase small subunit
VAKELHQLGLLTRIDRAALAAYCEAWGAWIEAVEAIQRTGPVVKAPSGDPILNPHLAVANQAYGRMRAMLVEFGMTPAARSRVNVTIQQDVEDEAERFFA